jgi:hypothetical protein
MTIRNSSRSIARTAAPGCRDELLQRFHSSSAALANGKVGCLKYRASRRAGARSCVRVHLAGPRRGQGGVWRAWQQSHLPEGYSALITAYSVHHFLVSESSTTK